MAKNYAIFRAAKLKSHKDIVNVLKEQQRYEQYQSDRADPELEHLNEYSGSYQDAIDLYDSLLPDKVRKNAVVGLAFVVSASQEFDSRDAEESYYTMAREFISERFGTIVGWSIHRDETSTHMQVTTIPLDSEGKLNARALIGGDKHRMQRIQDEFYEQVGAPHQLDRGVSNPRTRHVDTEEYHRQQLRELQERQDILDTRTEQVEEREREAESIIDSVASAQALDAEVQAEKAEWDVSKELAVRDGTKQLYADNKRMHDALYGGSDTAELTTPDGWRVKLKKGLIKLAAGWYDALQRYLRMTPAEFEKDYNKRQAAKLRRRSSGKEIDDTEYGY